MFETFAEKFTPDRSDTALENPAFDFPALPALSMLFSKFAGASFRQGLYRVIRAPDFAEWNGRVALAFPAFGGQVACFGYDWLARVFAVDLRQANAGYSNVILFEPGSGQALAIPARLDEFHDRILIENAEAALAESFHKAWLAGGGAVPGHAQCIGYKVPLFLGGKDAIGNLELSDIDVYWHIAGQLIAKTRGPKPGAPRS